MKRNNRIGSLLILLSLCLLLGLSGCKGKTPQSLLKEAMEAVKRGDVYGASFKCEKVISDFPDTLESYQARFILANCLASSNDFDGARAKWAEIYEKVPLTNEISQNSFKNRLGSWVQEKKYNEAINDIQKMTSMTQTASPAFYWEVQSLLQDLYVMSGQAKKAESLLLKDVENATSPTIKLMYNMQLADFYVAKTKEFDKALALLAAQRTEAKTEMELQEVIRRQAGVLALQSKFEEAINLYQERVKNAKTPEIKRDSLWGVASLQRAAAEQSKDTQVRETMKNISNKTYLEVIELTRADMDKEMLDAKKVPLLMRIVQLYQEMGDDKNAIKTLCDYMDKNKDNKPLWAALSQRVVEIYLDQKDFANAKIWLKKIVQTLEGSQEGMMALNMLKQLDAYEAQMKAAAATSGTLQTSTTMMTSGTMRTAALPSDEPRKSK